MATEYTHWRQNIPNQYYHLVKYLSIVARNALFAPCGSVSCPVHPYYGKHLLLKQYLNLYAWLFAAFCRPVNFLMPKPGKSLPHIYTFRKKCLCFDLILEKLFYVIDYPPVSLMHFYAIVYIEIKCLQPKAQLQAKAGFLYLQNESISIFNLQFSGTKNAKQIPGKL